MACSAIGVLRGFYESQNKSPLRGPVEFKSTSHELLRRVQLLLLGTGIRSKFSQCN
jgi:intein/homing endonuclease